MLHWKSCCGCSATCVTFFLALATGVTAQDVVTVKPQGEYANIDTTLAIETMSALAKGTPDETKAAIEKIKAHPEKYAPPVFYALSKALFDRGEKDDAAFWFYAGQLRARIDANICADVSARQAVAVLNQTYGTPINQYTFGDIAKLEKLVPKVVEWERTTPYEYDRRWINLHGMGAMISGLGGKPDDPSQAALSLPEKQWDEIAEKTRSDYLKGFQEALELIKNRK